MGATLAADALDDVLRHAEQRHEMAHGHVELRTPPAGAGESRTVILPHFGGATRPPELPPEPRAAVGAGR